MACSFRPAREAGGASRAGGTREGFVVRTARGYADADFTRCVAKYVRRGHVQTDDTWLRTWREARIKAAPPVEGAAHADPSQQQDEGDCGTAAARAEEDDAPRAADAAAVHAAAAALPCRLRIAGRT